MRERNKLAYLKEYRKAKEVTKEVTDDLDFLDRVDGKFDPFAQALDDGNIEVEDSQPTKRARKTSD